MFSYNKLVRDKIPEIIQKNGEKPHTRILDDDRFRRELTSKLFEEAAECVAAQDNPQELLAELVDLQEVIDTLVPLLGSTPDEIRLLQSKKREARGGFSGRVFLVAVD
jgi:predicted house-cleaning noncanonical NTP pyrophosphatase (MazG superfamily)